jgi:creatinine amidohydrolase
VPALPWSGLTRAEVAAAFREGAVAAIATGALEQHGEHLPCGTDNLLVDEVLREAAQRARATVVLLPALPFGLSAYHQQFGGTVALRESTFAALLADVAESVRAAGAPALVVVNGHGGNTGLVRTSGLADSRPGFPVVGASYWELLPGSLGAELFPADGGSIGHAGQAETSLMYALFAERVRLPGGPVAHEPARAQYGFAIYERLGETGVIGDPAAADAEAGRAFFDAAARAVAELLDALAARTSR